MKKWILIVFLCSSNLFGQSAWNLNDNSWYAQLNYTKIGPYSELFVNGNDTAETSREMDDNTIQLYTEYGLNDKLTLSFNLPLKIIRTGSQVSLTDPMITEKSITSMGNIGLGIKRSIYNNGLVISAGLNIEANTSTYDDPSGIRTGYDAWTIMPAAFFGKSFSNLFIQGMIGAGFRTNNYSEFFRGGFEVGYLFFDRLWTILYFDYKESFNNGTVSIPDNNLNTFLYVDNQEYIGYGLKMIYNFTDQFGISTGFGGAFSANAEARKAALNLGLFIKIDRNK